MVVHAVLVLICFLCLSLIHICVVASGVNQCRSTRKGILRLQLHIDRLIHDRILFILDAIEEPRILLGTPSIPSLKLLLVKSTRPIHELLLYI